jgi:ABC-type nitrate/sulfonate/bicarbonate transport systems, periplasmic components
MSTPIHLSLACGDYDINRGLIEGSVTPQGIDLTVLAYPSPPRHRRMGRHSEFDVCEFSMSSYLVAYDRQSAAQELTMEPVAAIPVFPHRRFRHSFIFVNSAAGVESAKDLEGRKVGLRTWQATAGLWARGILQDEYGVDLKKVIWYLSDDEAITAEPPEGFEMRRIPQGASVTQMLLEGELDALIYPEMPSALLEGDSRIRRLFPDYKQQEIGYYQKTGFFPIMHTVVIKKSVLDEHPWVARNMQLAFRESKDLAFKRMRDPRSISLAWVRELIEEQERILGTDPWAYTFADNVAALETMIRFSHEQGMISRRMRPEALFVPSTLGELPSYH